MINTEIPILQPNGNDLTFIFKGNRYNVLKGIFFCYSKKFQATPSIQQQREFKADFDVSVAAFEAFLSACQGRSFTLTSEIIYDLLFLATYWGVKDLSVRINQIIDSDPTGQARLASIVYKINHNLPTDDDEALIASQIDKFIDSDEVPKFPISILRRLIYSPSMQTIDQDKKFAFLKKCLEVHGKEASSIFADLVSFPLELNEVENLLVNEQIVLQPLPRNLAKSCYVESKRKDAFKSISKALNESVRKMILEIENHKIEGLDFSETIEQIETAANLGDAESQKTLSMFYKHGVGVPQNAEKAQELEEMASQMPREIPVDVNKFSETNVNFDVLDPKNETESKKELESIVTISENTIIDKNPLDEPPAPATMRKSQFVKDYSKMRLPRKSSIETSTGKTKIIKKHVRIKQPAELIKRRKESRRVKNASSDARAGIKASAEDSSMKSSEQNNKESDSVSAKSTSVNKLEEHAESSELVNDSSSIDDIKRIEEKGKIKSEDFEFESPDGRISLNEGQRRVPVKPPRSYSIDRGENEANSDDERPIPISSAAQRNMPLFKSYDSLQLGKRNRGFGNISSDHSKSHLPYVIEDTSKLELGENVEESIDILVKRCQEGDSDAAFSLGVIYAQGLGVEVDLHKALDYYEESAKKGDSRAMFNIASIYEFDGGDDIPQDLAKAFEWYSKAVQLDDPYAQTNLGSMYFNGNGVEVDKKKAAELYKLAADQGDSDSQTNLGLMYFFGNGIDKDDKMAADLFELAAEQNDSDAQIMLGLMYEEGLSREVDLKKAADFYRKAAEQGNADAQFNLGVMYENGTGVEKDIEKTIEWYTRSSQNGNSDAMYNLAVMYQTGENGVKKDSKKALRYYMRAAQENNHDALFNMGVMAMDGDEDAGVEKDSEVALGYFKKAAEMDCLEALFHLGTLYEDGEIVEKDPKKAVEYYLRAAELDDPAAQFNLALIYTNGAEGIEPDTEKAIEYFRLAAEQGDEDAEFNLKQLTEAEAEEEE